MNSEPLLHKIAKVLTDANKPLHYKEIAKSVESEGWKPRAGSVEAAVNACLNSDLRDRKATSIFAKEKRGIFKLQSCVKPEKTSVYDVSKLDAVEELCFTILSEIEEFRKNI